MLLMNVCFYLPQTEPAITVANTIWCSSHPIILTIISASHLITLLVVSQKICPWDLRQTYNDLNMKERARRTTRQTWQSPSTSTTHRKAQPGPWLFSLIEHLSESVRPHPHSSHAELKIIKTNSDFVRSSILIQIGKESDLSVLTVCTSKLR